MRIALLRPTSEDGGYLDVAEHQLNDTNAASVVAKDLSNDDFTFHVGGTTAAQTDDADFEFTSGGVRRYSNHLFVLLLLLPSIPLSL